MRCIKCLNSLKKFRLIFGSCSVLLSVCLVLSGLLSQSVNAVGFASTPSVTEVVVYNSSYVPTTSQLNFGTYGADITIPSHGLLNRLKFTFSLPDSIKSQMSGRQNFTISFGAWTSSVDLAFNSISGVNDFLPVITDFSVSPSCNIQKSYVYGYNPNDGNFYYPSGNSNNIVNECYYHLSIQGYIPDSENWDGIFSFGGTIVSNYSLSNQFLTVYRPALTLFDSESTQIQGSIDSQTQQQQEYHDETQQTFDDAQDTASSDSESSAEDASQSGSTLLSAFTSFVGALTSANASNCVINGDMGNLDLGNIDLCQLSPPPAFQTISSIMVIGFMVPLSVALAKKMISLFRSFQT